MIPDITAQSRQFQQLWADAQRHASRNEWEAARGQFHRLLRVFPGHAPSSLELSYVESFLGRYRAARICALQAYEDCAEWPQITSDLVARLRTFNEGALLVQLAGKMLDATVVDVRGLVDLAVQFSNLNVQREAMLLLDAAVKIEPVNHTILLLRAQVLIYLGAMSAAESTLDECVRHFPDSAHAYWLLSRARKQTPDHNHIQAIEKRCSLASARPLDIALWQYALHKEQDDLGQHAAAWKSLDTALRAKRSLTKYDSKDSKSLTNRLVAMKSPGALPRLADRPPRNPIFIVGMHRSGTTLLEQLLDGHSDVQGIGELYDFTSQMRFATDHHCRGVIDSIIVERAQGVDLAEVGRGYLAGIEWRLGKERFFTDKLPSNFLNIGFICQALPQAKILHMVRDPVETCFSNLRELFSDANPYSYDQIELADYFLQYRRLMRHWHAAYPGRILDVDYAELTRDPERVLREVCSFCELDFEPGMLDLSARTRGVATASAVQVRQKVVAREKPKWEPYAAYLQPLIQRLQSGESPNQV